MQRIIIMIEDGQLIDVLREHDAEDIMVELIDFDNLKASGDEDEEAFAYAKEVAEEAEAGKLVSCW